MSVLGLIVEYNPFHNGHMYHIQRSLEATGADYCICVMSGNYIQRGEPAVINKWVRTEAALLSGIDLVIELPVVFAMSSAEYFAYGAVKILDSLGVTDYLCFGSECGCVEEILPIAEMLANEPEEYKVILKKYLDTGLSFPSAREKAVYEYFNHQFDAQKIRKLLGSPNNILGIEYLKALTRLNSTITPYTIKRLGSDYSSHHITSSFSSAASIRKILKDNTECQMNDILSSVMPNQSCRLLLNELQSGRGPVFTESFEQIIISNLRRMTEEQISKLPFVSEGLENRIKNAAERCGSIGRLIEQSSARRYTVTRLQRILFHTLTSLTASELNNFIEAGGPQYIRILGFSKRGRELLSAISNRATLPMITKAADYKRSSNLSISRMLEIEAASTDMYVLAYQNADYRYAGQEFTQNVVRI